MTLGVIELPLHAESLPDGPLQRKRPAECFMMKPNFMKMHS
jgi:hypothetical protein